MKAITCVSSLMRGGGHVSESHYLCFITNGGGGGGM